MGMRRPEQAGAGRSDRDPGVGLRRRTGSPPVDPAGRKDFNAARDDIRLELETPDWKTQRESLISTTVIGEGPDVIRVHHKYSVEFGELGGLLPLEMFSDWPEVRQRLFGNVLEHVRYRGRHYGLPVTMLPFVLAANRSILDRYGVAVPRTWGK